MRSASGYPVDFTLVLHETLSESYELSKVLLAKAGFDGTLQLLTSGWERVLGYGRHEFRGKTLFQLMWSNRLGAAAAVAAILDELNMRPLNLRIRCRDGRGKSLTLHRLYDRQEQMMYIVAEEAAAKSASVIARGKERRAAPRHD